MAVLDGGGKLEGFLAGLARKLKGGAVVKVGFLEGATYPDGTPVAMIAAIQNFGAPAASIPPRPFFSNMILKCAPDWGRRLGNTLKASDYDAALTLARMGEGIAGQLRTEINETNAPPLAQSTIDAKGFSKPLIDTGHMWNSVAYEVAAGGDAKRYIDAGGTGAYAEGDVGKIAAEGLAEL